MFVEPLPNVFRSLVANYDYLRRADLQFVNAAISNRSGNLEFFTVADAAKNSLSTEQWLKLSRKSSFDRDAVEAALHRGGHDSSWLVQVSVPTYTVEDLLEGLEWSDPIDALILDTEGHDGDILESLDFRRFHPSLILFESHRLGTAQERVNALLRRQNYRLHVVGGDTVAETFMAVEDSA